LTEQYTEPAPTENKSWLLAFKDIFFAPRNIPSRAPFPIGKVAAVAVVMYILSALLAAFINDSHTGLRHENFRLRARPIEIAQKKGDIPPIRSADLLKDLEKNYRFQLTTALTATLPIAATWLLFSTLIVWVFQSILFKNSLTFAYTLAFVSFGNAIDAAGNLLKTGLHAVAGTLRADPSLSVFADPQNDPIMFAFLSRVDIFTIWQYIAIALAIAAYLNADRRKAYILAALTILVVILYFGAGAFLGSMLVA
jgi:hypothetical protein